MSSSFQHDKVKRIEKLSKKEQLGLLFDLINAFSKVKTPFDTALLIQDLLTTSEVKKLAKRLRIAKLLLSGKTHREKAKEVRCGQATVTKVNIWLQEGGEGLKETIRKLPKRYKMPKKLPPIPLEFQMPQLIYTLAKYSLVKRQQGKIKSFEKFQDRMEGKKITDKSLQEAFDEEFRHLHHKKKQKKTSKF